MASDTLEKLTILRHGTWRCVGGVMSVIEPSINAQSDCEETVSPPALPSQHVLLHNMSGCFHRSHSSPGGRRLPPSSPCRAVAVRQRSAAMIMLSNQQVNMLHLPGGHLRRRAHQHRSLRPNRTCSLNISEVSRWQIVEPVETPQCVEQNTI